MLEHRNFLFMSKDLNKTLTKPILSKIGSDQSALKYSTIKVKTFQSLVLEILALPTHLASVASSRRHIYFGLTNPTG